MDIEKRIKEMPASAGVYIFLGKPCQILYIGKASNLRRRVASYFRKRYHPPRTRAMVSKIKNIDYIPTSSGSEALIYEARLIKEKKPKYNVELKDDKSYPFLKLSLSEKFPRLFITREKPKAALPGRRRREKQFGQGKDLYYGPYTNVKLLRKALSEMRGIFKLRSCRNLPKSACLKAHIRQCLAPCIGRISEKEYRKIVEEVRFFLEGKKESLLKSLSERMRQAARKEEYEKALALREKIEALSAMWSQRKPPPLFHKELSQLKEILGLRILPARIEAFDISNISGKEAVGSMVSFVGGKPAKGEYRRFRIKTVTGMDDYDMIREVVRRRYTGSLMKKNPLPDLILIDGGKGHLQAAKNELRKIASLTIPVISIAKEKELVYTEGRTRPLELSRRLAALKLIIRVRNEAHRFAFLYHKLLRKKKLLGK